MSQWPLGTTRSPHHKALVVTVEMTGTWTGTWSGTWTWTGTWTGTGTAPGPGPRPSCPSKCPGSTARKGFLWAQGRPCLGTGCPGPGGRGQHGARPVGAEEWGAGVPRESGKGKRQAPVRGRTDAPQEVVPGPGLGGWRAAVAVEAKVGRGCVGSEPGQPGQSQSPKGLCQERHRGHRREGVSLCRWAQGRPCLRTGCGLVCWFCVARFW